MTHQQIRELRSAIEMVDLHCDVITELPLEITRIILQYLPLHQIFQAQRVSSNWRQILSSTSTVEHLLRDWFPKGEVGLGLRIPKGVSSEFIASLKAEHVDAFRTGSAFSSATNEWDRRDCFEYGAGTGRAEYAEGIMAWIDRKQFNQIRTLDLKTGQKGFFLSEDRMEIDKIAISSSMVVALNPEGCRVWTLTTGESYRVRYRHAPKYRTFISASGKSVAFAYPKRLKSGERGFRILTWTLKDQRLSRLFVAIPNKTRAQSMMFDSNGETLLFFYSSLSYEAPLHFYYSRTNLDGGVLAQGVIEIPNIKSYHDLSCYAIPKESNRRAVIWSIAKWPHNSTELMLIYYNFQENRLEIQAHRVDGLGMRIDTTSLFYWKDVVYYADYGDKCCNLGILDLQDLTCRKAKIGLLPFNTDENGAISLLGDGTFLIATFRLGFRVWCFDKNVQLFNEDFTYKEWRKNNINKGFDLK